MNLVAELKKGHSKAICDRIVRHVGSDPARFRELIAVFLAGPYRITQRAAWPLTYCVEAHPALIRPHLKSILNNLKRRGQHVAVTRNTIRLLQFIDIPPSLQGLATSICFGFLQDTRQPIAVRVFSMTVLGRIARVQPELKTEIRLLIEDQLPYASAGYVARARKVLRQLE